jgi:hypothetical protein
MLCVIPEINQSIIENCIIFNIARHSSNSSYARLLSTSIISIVSLKASEGILSKFPEKSVFTKTTGHRLVLNQFVMQLFIAQNFANPRRDQKMIRQMSNSRRESSEIEDRKRIIKSQILSIFSIG